MDSGLGGLQLALNSKKSSLVTAARDRDAPLGGCIGTLIQFDFTTMCLIRLLVRGQQGALQAPGLSILEID